MRFLLVLCCLSVSCLAADAYRIRAKDGNRTAWGTAFLYEGCVVTAAHVIEGKKEFEIEVSDGDWTSIKLLNVDKDNDVAVLRADGKAKKLKSLKKLNIPAELDVDGSNAAEKVKRFSAKLTQILLAADEVQEGSSGAPVTIAGRLVGIITTIEHLPEGRVVKVQPVEVIDRAVEQFKKSEE